jgi:rhamnosyltransferase subunit A
LFKQYVGRSSFAVAEHTGHLLDLESREAALAVHRALLDFLVGEHAVLSDRRTSSGKDRDGWRIIADT